MLTKVTTIAARITMSVFGTKFSLRVERDNKNPENGRIFLQVYYSAPCTKTGALKEWHGRKWYLSEHMTADEIVKTAYAAFKAAVEHEIMEGFKVDNTILFNPHIDFETLLDVSYDEVSRDETNYALM
jgi:hypothetical protein